MRTSTHAPRTGAALRACTVLACLPFLAAGCGHDPTGAVIEPPSPTYAKAPPCAGVPSGTSSLQIAPSAQLTIGVGTSLKYNVANQSGVAVPDCALTWSTSNSKIATVGTDGTVTGKALGGPVTIKALTSGKPSLSISRLVNVGAPVATVSVTSPVSVLNIDQTAQLLAVAKDAKSNTLTNRLVTWKSSAPAIVMIDGSGLVKALASGRATLTATVEGVSGSTSIDVTFSSPALRSTQANPFACGITLGGFGNPTVFSVSAWIRPQATNGALSMLLDASHGGEFNWNIQGADGFYGFAGLVFPVTLDTWQHLLATYDNGNMKVYIDGKLVAAKYRLIMWNSANPTLYLANWSNCAFDGRRFAGDIDDLYITYDLQQTADFTPPQEITAPSSHIFGLWHFNEGTGDVTANSSGIVSSLGAFTWTSRSTP